MEVCELCKKDGIKNMGVHLRKAHDISIDEYKLMTSEDTELTDEINETLPEEDSLQISNEERTVRIMDTKAPITPETTVGELLALKEMTLEDLLSVIKEYKSGTPSVSQVEKQNEEEGLTGANKLRNQENPSTTNLHVAEALTNMGFEVTGITKNPKTWHLTKAK